MSTNRPLKKVMISSTSLDLPEHRQQVIEACLRMDCTPLPMETLGARNADAVQASLDLVDQADLYIGILAHRYGFVPPGSDKSVTEIEYDRAVERGIPRLIFFMHDDHPITAKDVEKGAGAEKLQALKDRIGLERVAAFFVSKEDLRAHVVQALSPQRESAGEEIQFHYVSEIPEPPEPYIAHPYVLLQSGRLVGRQKELNLLTDWVAKPGSLPYGLSLFHVVAIGGQGKSALTWHWFQNVAEQEMKPLAGRMWWSFYESDASFENFVIRGLAYVTRKTIDEVRQIAVAEREGLLLAALDREPHLIVLDGLERLLIAYSGQSVGGLQDDALDAHTANFVAAAYGLPATAAQSYTGQHRLRLTADPRIGAFLKKLTHVRKSRILISTRLYPADLQTSAQGEPVASCFACFLPGLTDDDALSLWRAFGAKGSRETMLPMLTSFDKHPLLVQALASVVFHDRRAVGDFDAWRQLHSDFDPFPLLSSNDRKSHVLAHALRGIDEQQQLLLQTIAGFRMPTTYETLVALFVQHESPLYATEPDLDAALAELEDRGLLGWDRRANRYDLHPIVRGVVWSGADTARRREVFTTMHDHFAPIETKKWREVESLDDLTPAIEMFHALISLQRYEDAFVVFRDRLEHATLWRLSAHRVRMELIERLFPNGLDQAPRLTRPYDQGYALNALALSLVGSGKPGAAVSLFQRVGALTQAADDKVNLHVGLCNLSEAQQQSGDLRSAEASLGVALRNAKQIPNQFHECVNLQLLGLISAIRNASPDACSAGSTQIPAAMGRSLSLSLNQGDQQRQGLVRGNLSEISLWCSDVDSARSYADSAWEMASSRNQEADFIKAARLQGTAALRAIAGDGTNNEREFLLAHERLNHALIRVRSCQRVDEELPTLIALAELYCVLAGANLRAGNPQADPLLKLSPSEHLREARLMLDDVWERVEEGPYPLFHADALNIRARIERTAAHLAQPGSTEAEQALAAAKKAALQAYEKAWCQGPPFAYAFGLYHAKKHLTELGVPFPDLPPYDDSLYEPMPEVEIDPPEPEE